MRIKPMMNGEITNLVRCNLCGMIFDEGDAWILMSKKRHEEWHSTARQQKRNTTQGTVKWECD
jgi:uncharacterized C2H2 Zn-finger protein